MDWYKEIKDRKKKIKEIGTTEPLELIIESIEHETGYPCRLRYAGSGNARFASINIYSKTATRKQIQYDRCIIHSHHIYPQKDGEMLIRGLDYQYKLPHDISEVVKVFTDRKYENQYIDKYGLRWME